MPSEYLTREDLDLQESASLLGGGSGSVELRQRARVSFSSRDSDDDGVVDFPRLRSSLSSSVALQQSGAKQDSACPGACFVFSLAGLIFLSIIAAQLGSNSIYLRVSRENSSNKAQLAEGVQGAAAMYGACAVISGWFWWRQRNFSAGATAHVAID